LGSETPIWTESADGHAVPTRIFPRASALAERLWTNPRESTWIEAERRFIHHRERLANERGIPSEALQPTWCHLFEDRCRKTT